MQSKYFLKSTTVIGFIVAALGFIGNWLGLNIAPGDPEQVGSILTTIATNIDQIMEVGGGLVMMWGRWKAKGPLTMKASG
jgi:uncharacterized membrane protein YphA (DoxX/SURF4 family)